MVSKIKLSHGLESLVNLHSFTSAIWFTYIKKAMTCLSITRVDCFWISLFFG